MPGELLRVDVGDLTFDVRVDGPEDGRPVLLLHGFPQTSAVVGRGDPAAGRGRAAHLRARPARATPPARGPAEVDAYSMPNLAQVTADLMTALDVPARRRRRARLGRERGVDAGRLAPRPGALADRRLGAAPGGVHGRLPGRPGAEGALGLHPAVLAGRARPRRCCSPTTPAGCGGCCRRRRRHRGAGGGDRRVRRRCCRRRAR